MNNSLLDKFGETLIHAVRDAAIADWDKIIDGRMKGNTAERVRADLQHVDGECLDVLRRLVPQIVDTVLHHLLWTIDQTNEIDVLVIAREGDPPSSVKETSDGLAGELYGDKGWIARFTTQRYIPL